MSALDPKNNVRISTPSIPYQKHGSISCETHTIIVIFQSMDEILFSTSHLLFPFPSSLLFFPPDCAQMLGVAFLFPILCTSLCHPDCFGTIRTVRVIREESVESSNVEGAANTCFNCVYKTSRSLISTTHRG